MPIISNMRLPFGTEDVVRAWGSRRGRLATPAMLARLNKILAQVESARWMEPAITYRTVEISGHGPAWVELPGGVRLNAPLLAHRLGRASHLVFGACTIGTRLSRKVSEWFNEDRQLEAVMLDEIGTLALYKLGDRLEALVCEQASSMALQASGSLSPGEEGFDLGGQGTVLALAGGYDIGVSLKGAGLLVPQKSLTAVIGLGERMPAWSRGESCARCKARERCPHRQDLTEGAAA